jgi:hypothetical protein
MFRRIASGFDGRALKRNIVPVNRSMRDRESDKELFRDATTLSIR